MSGKSESMAEFFDHRAQGYDAHMRHTLGEDFVDYYESVARSFHVTDQPVKVLDLGAGTGLELDALWRRAPQAQVTAIDVSPGMLRRLQMKYSEAGERLTPIEADYLQYPLTPGWDYIVSVMSLHHLLPDLKGAFYRRLWGALKPTGRFIEADYVVSPSEEIRILEALETVEAPLDGTYHIDVPLSLPRQIQLLEQAGFVRVRVMWHRKEAAILVCEKQ